MNAAPASLVLDSEPPERLSAWRAVFVVAGVLCLLAALLFWRKILPAVDPRLVGAWTNSGGTRAEFFADGAWTCSDGQAGRWSMSNGILQMSYVNTSARTGLMKWLAGHLGRPDGEDVTTVRFNEAGDRAELRFDGQPAPEILTRQRETLAQ